MRRSSLIACRGLLTVGLAGCAADPPAGSSELVVGYVGSSDSAHMDAWRGAQLGADEAAHAARLIGRSFTMIAAHPSTAAQAARAAHRLIGAGATVLVGGDDAA